MFDPGEELIGMKVIVRSNEDEPYRVGIFKGMTECGSSFLCRVECEELGLIHPMGVVIPHTDEMAGFLDGLTPRKQWEILSGVSLVIQTTRLY
jgi:hypothetical protein